MSYRNVLVLMSDEHSNKMLGCHGHPTVRTPNLDSLACRGTRFANAYTNSPICIPARAALATGRYTFETGCWDNALPYHGTPHSWGHALREHGIRSCSIGKLHYRNAEDDTGFTEQILPMHVVEGVGDLLGSIRDPLPVRHKSRAIATEIGPGESAYTRYDRDITDAACTWLASNSHASPWVLFVSWVAPHFPLISPQAFYDLYDPAALPLPKAGTPQEWPRHPWLDAFRECFITDRFFTDESRRIAIASYYGLVSFLDHNIGRVLDTLESSSVSSNTLIIYLSDHGDNLGTRGLWGKSTMYEESAAVPMILAGQSVPENRVVQTPVSLVDLHRTLMDAFDLPPVPETRGDSLLRLSQAPNDPHRTVFSEYHAAGAATGSFMLRDGRYKYVHYVNMPPQLFDLQNDPEELTNIAQRSECTGIVADFQRSLQSICDPVAVDRKAKADQNALLARYGGRDKIMAQGGFGATPAPGQKPQYE
jgi:choline-sulfatase